MSATVPGAPKTSYVRCLGLKGLPSSTLVSAYESCFSEPKMPCSRDTVKPPATTTTSMTSGTHSRLRTLKIENPPFRRLFRDPCARGAGERLASTSQKSGSAARSLANVSATLGGGIGPGVRDARAHRCSTTALNLPPVSTPRRMSVVGHTTTHRPRHPSTLHRMWWASQAGRATVTSNVQRLWDATRS